MNLPSASCWDIAKRISAGFVFVSLEALACLGSRLSHKASYSSLGKEAHKVRHEERHIECNEMSAIGRPELVPLDHQAG